MEHISKINTEEEYLKVQDRTTEITSRIKELVDEYAQSVYRLDQASKDYQSQVEEIISGTLPLAEAELLKDIANTMVQAVMDRELSLQNTIQEKMILGHKQITFGLDMMIDYMRRIGNKEMVSFLELTQATLQLSMP